jgi:hypothetical protein
MSGLIDKNDASTEDVATQEELRQQPATPEQIGWLSTLMWERGFVAENHTMPKTRGEASRAINQIRTEPALPATDEQLHEIDQLAKQVGITIVNDGTFDRARANKILLSLRRKAQNANVPASNGDFVARLKAEAAAKAQGSQQPEAEQQQIVGA